MNNNTCAIFLDRDGTLIVDKVYLSDSNAVELLPKTREAIDLFLKNNCTLFLFSNQSGVSRGLFALDDVYKCNSKMLELINLGSNIFASTCIATELPTDNILYRKPSPKFILEMIKAHNLSPQNCFMIGDKLSDVQAGYNAKINSVLLTPKDSNIAETAKLNYNAKIAETLFDFAISLHVYIK